MNFHPPFSEPPSFIFDFSEIITKIHPPFQNPGSALELYQLFKTLISKSAVSIKFEVGSWLKKNNRLYEQGAVRAINLGGSGGMLSQKILKSEMPFPAF